MFSVRFWRFMTCFWINSRPSGNLEESIFGSLIKDLFFITFLESGRVDFRMVSFGRDMQKSQRFRPKFCRQSSAVIQFCSEFCRVLQKYILECMRSSAEKPPEGKLCGTFADNSAEVSSGLLYAWSYKDCIRIYARRIMWILLWCSCMLSFVEFLIEILQ